MSIRMTRALLGVATAFTLLGAGVSASATEILAIRHWSSPERTRIVLDLSGPASYLHRELGSPPRVAVDVADSHFRIPVEAIPIDDGVVERVRFNRLAQSGKAQVVLDLTAATGYDVFALERFDEKRDRIVIDVRKPAAPASPMPSVTPSGRPRAPRQEHAIDPETFGDFVVMVDPGHGGEDTGRQNPDGLREKHLALEFSKALADEINSRVGFRAELTRTGDYFISLKRRRDLAEERGAHLFVSVHFNSAPSRTARGTEIFFVSLRGAEDRMTRELVEAENSADLVGGLAPRDEDTTTDLTRMLVDLRQSDSVERSQQLAVALNDHVDRVPNVVTRNVKQAGFAVLKSLFIPAVLVEVGFLTNREDANLARSSRHRERYVEALTDGLVEYCERVEIPRLGWKIHTVSRGESLSQIAGSYAMNLQALRDANQLSGDRIREGQRLRVRTR
ncbi:MAG: N-acetylmuramoyl-L-alanine amidase [Gemmatimonadota bacterium]|nr:MAG: N-acetylmuramoyl-L-alanine amidase [Gemmatimonadota bacterium]